MIHRSAATAGPLVLLVLTAWLVLPSLAAAQIRFLPDSEYDRVNIRKPQAIQARLESLQSTNDFEPIKNFKPESRFRRLARPVGRLKVKVRDDSGRVGMALCTASIISEELLLTNNHCIPGGLGVTVLAAKIEMDYLDANDTAAVKSYEVDPSPVETNQELDYSLVRVHGNPAAEFGTAKLSRKPGALQDAVFIIHHPEGAPKTLSRKDCYINTMADREFVHSCDTLGGSSGSPIFSDESFQIVGLHFAGSEQGNYGKNIATLLSRSPRLESVAVTAQPAPPPAPDEPPPPREQPPPPRRDPVQISLASEPAGAGIYFGEVLVGVTPLTFSMVEQPAYTFTLRKQGYEDTQVALERHGPRVSHEATLRRKPGPPPREDPLAMDPASKQMRAALDYWTNLDESDFAGAEQSSKGRSDAAAQQRDKSNQLFEKDDFFK